MADYVPFPDQRATVETDASLTKKALGCFGCGGLGVMGFLIAAVVLIGVIGSVASGCDTDLASPGQGTDTERLPVTVTPRTALTDGATVRVRSDAFERDNIVGIAPCLRSADTERRGVAACDEVQGARFATDGEGRLDATYRVPRVITVGGLPYDCAAKPRRCVLVAASANHYDQSGGQPLTFRGDLPGVKLAAVAERAVSDHLPIGADPALTGPVRAGTQLTVLATGFQPGEPLLIAYCTPDLEKVEVADACEPLDASDAVTAIMLRSVDGDFVTADAAGALATKLEARATVLPVGGDLAHLSPALTTTSSEPGSGTRTSTTALRSKDEVRCTAATGGCSIVIAAAADTKRSAVLPYTVAG